MVERLRTERSLRDLDLSFTVGGGRILRLVPLTERVGQLVSASVLSIIDSRRHRGLTGGDVVSVPTRDGRVVSSAGGIDRGGDFPDWLRDGDD